MSVNTYTFHCNKIPAKINMEEKFILAYAFRSVCPWWMAFSFGLLLRQNIIAESMGWQSYLPHDDKDAKREEKVFRSPNILF
jgi:hypothetical protein